jgi:PST family polysaccharide transporter
VATIITVLAVNFVLAGIQVVPQSLLVRDLAFRRLAWVHGAETLTLTACTITLAFAGAGYWALVLGQVAARVATTTLLLRWRPHRPAWPFPFRPIMSEVTFGWQFMVSNVAWYCYTNADFAIVGRVLGKVVLGSYTIAWSLASVPVERISALFGNVFRGVFSAVQHDRAALARYLSLLTEGLSIVTFPLAAGLSLVADDAVRVVLGERWLAAVPPLRLLALYAMVRSVATLLSPILVATDHTRLNMRFNLVAAAVMPLLFLLGTRWGMVGVAVVWIVGYTGIVGIMFLPRVLRIVGMGFGQYARATVPAALATAAMAAVVLAVRQSVDAGSALRLGMSVLAGAVTYCAVLWLVHGTRLRHQVRVLLDALRPQSSGPAPAPAPAAVE